MHTHNWGQRTPKWNVKKGFKAKIQAQVAIGEKGQERWPKSLEKLFESKVLKI
jgi:hypothetical protein